MREYCHSSPPDTPHVPPSQMETACAVRDRAPGLRSTVDPTIFRSTAVRDACPAWLRRAPESVCHSPEPSHRSVLARTRGHTLLSAMDRPTPSEKSKLS